MNQNSDIKSDLVNWFIKNVVVANLMRLDTPGFVTVKQNYKGENIEQRNLFFSENQLTEFETTLVKELGEEGRKTAYSIGVDFAYAYCYSYAMPRLGIDSDKSVEGFMTFFNIFMGVTWGEFLSYKLDIKAKTFLADLGDHIVCRKDGLGYIFTSGTIAGGWQYIYRDPVQAVETQCIGKGADMCKVVCGPVEYMKQNGYTFYTRIAKTTYNIDVTSREMNKPRKLQYSKASIKELIAANVFNFENNKLTFHSDRYYFTSCELLYVMEQFASENSKIAEILFKSAFNQGATIAQEEKNNEYSTFIPDILAALGFGDTLISHDSSGFRIETNYYPYLDTYDKIDYYYFRGLVSGLLSGFSGKQITLKSHNVDVSSGYLKLNLY